MKKRYFNKIKNLPSVTVAIPAHNEDGVILNILNDIQMQEYFNCEIVKVIVYCDGCSDSTAKKVRKKMESNSIISIYEGRERIGKIRMLNRIFRENDSDFLIILDADIGLDSKKFVQSFVKEAINNQEKVMFSAHQTPLRPKNIIGRIFHASFLMWDYVRLSIPNKDHVENFYGAATIYRKDFAKSIMIPDSITGMRTYLYLLAKRNGGFYYADKVSIKYWPPHTFADFAKLRKRVYGSDLDQLMKIFGEEVGNIYFIDRKYKIKGVLRFIKDYPFYALPAIITSFLLVKMTKIYQRKNPLASGLWEKAHSTKKNMTTFLENKKIIFSNYDDVKNPWYGGGGAVAIHEIAKRLKDDFKIKVLTGKYPNYKNERIDGVYYQRIGLSFVGPKIGQLCYSFVLPFYVIKEKFDIWFESFTPPFTTGLLPLFTRRPVIGVTHMLSGMDMYRKYKIPFYFFEQLGLKIYRRIIVLSDVLETKVKRYNKKVSIRIIPDGVELQEKNNNRKVNNKIGFLGRIEINQKGLDLLLKAFNRVKISYDWKLLIAGSGTNKQENILKKMLKKINSKKRAEFLGRIKNKEKEYFFSQVDFLVLPSREESFLIVVLEAFSYGLPVIVFDLENLKWIPDDCAIKVKPFDVDGLAKAMEKLMTDSDLRKKMGDRAWELSKNYSWDRVAYEYKNYIDDLLKKDERID